MAANELIPLAQHRPAALKMQSHLAAIKANGLQIPHGLLCHPAHQGSKFGQVMQLPNSVDIPRPSASRAGVANIPTPKSQQRLQMSSKIQRIDNQLGCGHNRWEQLVKSESHHSIKKAGPQGRPQLMSKGELAPCSRRTTNNFQDFLGNRCLTSLVVIKSESFC